MKRVLAVLTVLLMFTGYLFADYKQDVLDGVRAYKAKDYSKALKYFNSAYKVQPSEKLKKYIVFLEKKVKESGSDLLEEAGLDTVYGDWPQHKNVISTNLGYLALGIAGLSYDRVVTNSLSVGVDAGYSFMAGMLGTASVSVSGSGGSAETKGSGFMVGAHGNWYVQQKAPHTWFVGPELNYMAINVVTTSTVMDYYSGQEIKSETKAEVTVLNYGVKGGYTWALDSGFFCSLTLGLSMFNISAKADGGSASDLSVSVKGNYSLILPTMGASLGFAF